MQSISMAICIKLLAKAGKCRFWPALAVVGKFMITSSTVKNILYFLHLHVTQGFALCITLYKGFVQCQFKAQVSYELQENSAFVGAYKICRLKHDNMMELGAKGESVRILACTYSEVHFTR